MNLETAVTVCPTPAALVARDSRRADQVADELKQLDSNSTNIAFDQGELLLEIEKEAHYATKGFVSAEDFYKSLNLDVSIRELQYRRGVVRTMNTLGLSRADYAPAKISKLKVIAKLNPAGEIVDPITEIAEPLAPIMVRLVAAAPQMKLSEVEEQVDILLGKSGEEGSLFTWFNWPILTDAKQVVMDAIELARTHSGDTVDINDKTAKQLSDAAALERVAADYLADPNNQLEQLGTPGDYADSVEDGGSYEQALESETEG